MVVVLVVVVVVVVHPFVPLGAQGICEASPSDSIARQTLNLFPLLPHFPVSSKTVLFPPASLRIPIQYLFFNVFIPLPQSMTDPSPFSHSNLQYYRLLSSGRPQFCIAYYLRPSYAHCFPQTSISKRYTLL
jgi:hypothetical protein